MAPRGHERPGFEREWDPYGLQKPGVGVAITAAALAAPKRRYRDWSRSSRWRPPAAIAATRQQPSENAPALGCNKAMRELSDDSVVGGPERRIKR